jgi:glycosyltransferase involved in cell wall biosynthesis
MKKLKILIVTMDYPPPAGGIQIFTYNLEQSLKILGHEVRILNFDGRNISNYKKLKLRDFFYTPATLHPFFINPLYIFKPSGLRNFVYNNLVYRESRMEIDKFNPDIIHLMKPNLYSSVYNCRIPFLVTCHSEEIINIYPVRYSLQHASQIHCVSNFGKNKVLQITPSRKKNIKVIYNAIDLAQWRMNKMDQKKNWIITICRLVKRKNVDNIIKAIKLLPYSILKNYKYFIVGDGPERKNLEFMAKNLHLEENVFFKGEVSEAEKIQLLSNAKLFIMCPTTYKNENEGFGISFIEAQAAGIPVIGSKNGGSPEAIGNGGLLVEDELDPKEIAKNIELLLTDRKLYNQLVQNIQKRIGKFGTKKHVRKIEKIYKEVIDEYKIKGSS